MRNLKVSVAIALLVTATAANADPVIQAAPEAAPEAVGYEAQKKDDGVPAKKGRLRFKSSRPVCMCAEGMSERDIEKNRIKFEQDKAIDTISGAGR